MMEGNEVVGSKKDFMHSGNKLSQSIEFIEFSIILDVIADLFCFHGRALGFFPQFYNPFCCVLVDRNRKERT